MKESVPERVSRDDVLRMAVDVVAAYVSNNKTPTGGVPEVISTPPVAMLKKPILIVFWF